ncbi:MAG: hypothetical protein CVV22_02585 [Ignavibacteriae bacterium HGW-Ignavibacteriae-1]|jgi:hypothetical protein|nr:MAG: hypothetical protein CVV22_02585 [Ignavibacteriae bacterium HGW-Ignavibacteriae-1]
MKYFILLSTIVSLLLSHNLLKAQMTGDELLNRMKNSSNLGTEFYLAFHPGPEGGDGESEIKIFVTSFFETLVSVKIDAIDYYEEKSTIPNQTIEFTLTPEQALMYLKSASAQAEPMQVWEGRAIIVKAGDPVFCYGVARFGDKSGGYMALPSYVLGQKYQIATLPDPSNSASQFLPSYTSIVGIYDNTKITFRLGGHASTTVLLLDGSSLKPNEVARATLNEGDVMLIAGSGVNNDLTGSVISATKPVAVFSGNYCMGDKKDLSNCDYTIEQQTPESTWGKNYIVTSIANRKNPPITRIFTSMPNNAVFIDGHFFTRIKTVGGLIGTGYLDVRSGEMGISRPVVISSDYPINVVQYNPSKSDDSVASAPFQMQVIANEQFSNDCKFATVGADGLEFEKNFYNLVYLATLDGGIPQDLQVGNFSKSPLDWIPLEAYSGNPGAPVNLRDKDGRPYYSKILPTTEGIYQIKANDPFGLYQYGNDANSSFGTMASVRLRDLTNGDTLPPVFQPTPGHCCKGDYSGTVLDVAQVGVEPSNLASLSLVEALSYNYQCNIEPFTSGISPKTTLDLRTLDYWKPAKAVIIASDKSGNWSLKEINYTPLVNLSLNADNYDLGMIKSGHFRDFEIMLSNDREENTLPLEKIVLSNEDSQFEIIENIPENFVLGPLEEYTIKVRFRANDLYSDDIENLEQVFKNSFYVDVKIDNIIQSLGFDKEIEIEVANPRIIADDVDFSTHTIDEPIDHQYLKISNPGKMPLLITKFDFPAESPFVLELPEASEENPYEIEPFGEYLVKTEFIPTIPGEFSDTLTITSDAYIIKNVAVISASAIPSTVLDNNLYGGIFAVNYDGSSITFRSENDAIVSGLKIYDLNGRNIFNSDVTNKINEYRVAVPSFKTGVYLLHINIDGIWMSKKLIIL